MKKLPKLVVSAFVISLSGCVPPNTSPGQQATPQTSASGTPAPEDTAVPTPNPEASAGTPSPTESTAPLPGASGTPSAESSANPAGIARLEITTTRQVFSANGQGEQLRVIAYNNAGEQINAPALDLIWSSSQPEDISVSPTGLVRILKNTGSSTLRVEDRRSGLQAEIVLTISGNSQSENSGSSSGSGGGGGSGSGSGGGITPSASPPAHSVNTALDYNDVQFE